MDSHTYDFWGKCIPRGWNQLQRRDRSYVYFIASEAALHSTDVPQTVKIGVTSGDPLARLATFQTGSPCPLELVACVYGDEALERALHATFADYRLHGEWFSLSGHVYQLVRRFSDILMWVPDHKLIHEFDFAEAIAEYVLDWNPQNSASRHPHFQSAGRIFPSHILRWFSSIGLVRVE